jgi:RNA polymerase sigma-70 factor (ECF subfamily)
VGEPDNLPDEQLVLLTKDGDLAAFNSLVARYQGPVFNLCARLLGERQAAEDATQETFLSAYRAISRFDGRNVRGWLLRIAANQSKDELRRRGRKDRAGSLDKIFDTMDAPVEVPDTAEGIEQLLERKELGEALQSVLLDLPFDQRQAIVLVDVYGYRYEDVAEMTGNSVGTIKSRIHRGRERLREAIRKRPEQFAGALRLESSRRL